MKIRNDSEYAITRDSPLPLYYQIANVMRARIDAHEWGVNDRLPSEAALASSFGVSTATMRQALSMLEDQGRLIRRQGVGTLVAPEQPVPDRVRITIPLGAVSEPVARLTVRSLGMDDVRPPGDIALLLGLADSEKCTRIRRVRSSTRGPITYATTYMPVWLGSKLTQRDLNKSLMVDIVESKGIRISGAVQTIEASLADADSAAVLRVPIGAPILLVRRLYESEAGGYAFVAINMHPSHEIRYELRLSRTGSAPGAAWDMISGSSDGR